MKHLHSLLTAAILAGWINLVPTAWAGCTIDFEDLPLGTPVTNQYKGVTFSVQPGFWSGQPLYMRIRNPSVGTTSSPTKCLRIDPGAGSTSSEFLIMTFDLPQTQVSFTLGDQGWPYEIRSYSTVSGGTATPITVETVPGVHTLVNLAGPNIRRVEVQAMTSTAFETIDDLTFTPDVTPPSVVITYPPFGTCICSAEFAVRGSVCEADGIYGADVLEYMPVTGTAWTNIAGYSSPACASNSLLYTWPCGSMPDGAYYLRATVTNKCGLSSNALTVVTLHRTIDAASIRTPLFNFIVGGTVCVDGSAHDLCFAQYRVEKAPYVTGAFTPVDSAHPTYTQQVQNDPLASWNTKDNLTPDGKYLLRVTTLNACGSSAAQAIVVEVDNTPPVGLLTSPMPCSKQHGIVPIYGVATDAHLAGWTLHYSDPATHQWQPIAAGNTSVAGGLLANWDTTGLPACAYTLRLLVTDQSRVNLDCSTNSAANQVEYLLNLDLVSDPLAVDSDGDGMPDGWETAHGFNPYSPTDAAQDADGDGRTNLEEYSAGTDPRNAGSVLRITAVDRVANDIKLTWTTQGSHHYLIEGRSALGAGGFNSISPLIDIPPGSAPTATFMEIGAAVQPRRFYRVRLVP